MEVLTVHHEDEVRRRARSVVSATPGFEAVGEAVTAEEALELAVTLRPDLVLVGASMPGIDGLETSRRLVEALPGTAVVVLYADTAPRRAELAEARATAALQAVALTPESLQALWDRHLES